MWHKDNWSSFLQGVIFFFSDQTESDFWDEEADAKFESTEQEAKRLKED